jgi:hypothetical protein
MLEKELMLETEVFEFEIKTFNYLDLMLRGTF